MKDLRSALVPHRSTLNALYALSHRSLTFYGSRVVAAFYAHNPQKSLILAIFSLKLIVRHSTIQCESALRY